MEYYLNKNYLKASADDCIARTSTVGVLNKEDLISEISKEGTGITPYEVEAIFKRLEVVVTESLRKGYSINTPLINISPSVSGIFDNWDDTFDTKRHKLNFKASSGVLIKQAAKQTKMHKIDPKKLIIDIFCFVNHNSEESNELHPNGIGELCGSHLKLDASDKKQGIFLMAKDGTENRVEVYVVNTHGRQIFQIPDNLTPGNYTLELRTLPNQGKRLHKGSLPKPLVVC